MKDSNLHALRATEFETVSATNYDNPAFFDTHTKVEKMVPRPGFEPGCPKATDFRTTIAFATLTVCGLDFVFTIAHSFRCRV